MDVITRMEARARGLDRYFLKPCRKGHTCGRYVSDCMCVECNHERGRSYRQVNKERLNARNREYYRTPENKERKNRWEQENKARRNARMREYDSTVHRIRQGANSRARELAKRQATPPWISKRDFYPIFEEAERLRRETGEQWHVDHVVPICCTDRATGEQIACGLHVPWNVAPMLGVENLQKLHYVDRALLDAEQTALSRACAAEWDKSLKKRRKRAA